MAGVPWVIWVRSVEDRGAYMRIGVRFAGLARSHACSNRLDSYPRDADIVHPNTPRRPGPSGPALAGLSIASRP